MQPYVPQGELVEILRDLGLFSQRSQDGDFMTHLYALVLQSVCPVSKPSMN